MTDVRTVAPPMQPVSAAPTRWWPAMSAVYAGAMARARVARGPLLFVATLQSIGILALLRGVLRDPDRVTTSAIVAGTTVLVVAFVALNLLAQRFGALRAAERSTLRRTAHPTVRGRARVGGVVRILHRARCDCDRPRRRRRSSA